MPYNRKQSMRQPEGDRVHKDWNMTPDGEYLHKDAVINMDGEYELRRPKGYRRPPGTSGLYYSGIKS